MVNKEIEYRLNLINRSIVDLMELRKSLLQDLHKEELNASTIDSRFKIDFIY